MEWTTVGPRQRTQEHCVVRESRSMMVPGLASQVSFVAVSLVYHRLMSCRHQSANGRPSGAG